MSNKVARRENFIKFIGDFAKKKKPKKDVVFFFPHLLTLHL